MTALLGLFSCFMTCLIYTSYNESKDLNDAKWALFTGMALNLKFPFPDGAAEVAYLEPAAVLPSPHGPL